MVALLPDFAFPSLGTVTKRTIVQLPSGQWFETWLPSDDPTLVDIQCRKTPLILQRPATGEEVVDFVTMVDVTQEMVALKGYYPQIDEVDRFLIDGVNWDIKTVEHDGNHVYTRLRLEVVE
jgi:hypothetical protein